MSDTSVSIAPQRRLTARPAPRRRARAMLKAVGFDDEALEEADHRRRQHVDRDRPVQLPPARAGRAREGGHPRGRRHADGVQHRLHLRRHHDGHRGHAGVADQPRGHRRLDRAGGARQLLRRPWSRSAAATRPSRAPRWRWRGLDIPGLVLYGGSIAPGTLPRIATSRSRTSSRPSARTRPAR